MSILNPSVSSQDDLVEQIKELRPWHMGVQITEDLNTGMVFSDDGQIVIRDENRNQGISLLQLRDNFLRQIDAVYPDGMSGKRFLDCACNAGGYGFWLAERGLEYGLGFDVRDHWISQAKFIQATRSVGPTDPLEFIVSDLYEVPKIRLEPFDITMFKGIFYHLPDPITGLKIAADLTREHIILNTSTIWDAEDGYLKCGIESREHLMSGVHGLQWYPTGPKVLADILKWMGFVETKLYFYHQMQDRPELGRLEIHGSRTKGLLDNLTGDFI